MKITNKMGLPMALVKAVENDPYPNTYTGDISATRLIAPPQIRVLTKMFADQIEEDASDRLWALFGQIGHGVIERAEVPNELAEERYFTKVLGWDMSGQLDNYTLFEGVLSDYKFTTVYSIIFPKSDWEKQLNVLAFLLAENGLPVSVLRIIVLIRDWKISEAKRNKDYPQKNVAVVEVKLWSREEQLAYIKERVALHQQAESGNVPKCTDEERWASEYQVAVMKGANKRATKVFRGPNAMKNAEQFIADHKDGKQMKAEERPRAYRRCEDYCAVAGFCPQWQAELSREAA